MAAPNVVTLRQGEAIAKDVRLYPVPDVILLVDDTSPATITLSAPTQTELHAITLDAGVNTITLTAPAQSQSMAITLAAGSNTVTLSAPSQGQLVEITLAAGSNTITLSAPTVPSLVLTMPVDTNTITLSAPAQSQLMELTLAAGSNTVTLSAPDVPAVNLTMPVSTCTITLSAPAQSEVHAITLAAGANTITLSTPAPVVAATVTLDAGSNTITLSAPVIPAIDLTMPVDTNTITLSAPTVPSLALTMPIDANTITLTAPVQSEVHAVTLAAGTNTVVLSAPSVPAVHLTMPVSTCTITLSAPVAALINVLTATANIVTITAPSALLWVGVQFFGNYSIRSEELDVAPPWSPFPDVVIDVDAALAPDGTTTAEKVSKPLGNASPYLVLNYGVALTTDVTDVVYSIYLKAVEISDVSISLYNNVTPRNELTGRYDLTGSGTAEVRYAFGGVPGHVGILDVGGGWYRCWLSVSMDHATHDIASFLELNLNGDNAGVAGGLYAWGAQGEAGQTPSTYVRTTTDPVPVIIFTFAAPELTISAPTANMELTPAGTFIVENSQITITAPTAVTSHTLEVTTNTVSVTAPDATLLVGVQFYENLLMWSEQLDVGYPPWDTFRAHLAANATLAPDGTMTAEKIIDDLFGTVHSKGIFNDTLDVPNVTPYVFSVYLKAAEYTEAALDFFGFSSQSYAAGTFTLTGAGTAELIEDSLGGPGPHAVGIVALPDGWYRCWISVETVDAVTIEAEIYLGHSYFGETGDGVSGLYAWGAQLNKESVAPLPYLKTEGTTPLLLTVFTFDAPVITLTAPIAELVEQGKLLAGPNTVTITAPIAAIPATLAAVTNLLAVNAPDATLLVGVQFFENWKLQSEQLDDGVYWFPFSARVDANMAVAPDGTMTAEKLVETSVFGTHRLSGNIVPFGHPNMPDVGQAVFSVYLRAAEFDTASLNFYDSDSTTGYASGAYTLSGAGTAGDSGDSFEGATAPSISFGIENVGGGWYRCWTSIFMLLASSCHVEIVFDAETPVGDDVSGIYAWGAQVEVGSTPSAYIKTTTEVVPSTVFTFAPPALSITAPVAQFFDPNQIIVGTASQIILIAPTAVVSHRTGVLKVRAVARVTLLKPQTAALVTRTTPYEAPVAVLKPYSSLVMVTEPLDAKLGLVVSSSDVVVG